MIKQIGGLCALALFLTGCAAGGGAIPVVDAGRQASDDSMARSQPAPVVPPHQRESVVVMVPDADGGSRQVDSWPVDAPRLEPDARTPRRDSSVDPTLQADEQLDGPVLALLTSARQQEGDGNLNAASASLERAMRIAPREPQVLYRLARVRLAQGDAAQAEQLAQRALGYAQGRQTLQASLWQLIAEAREARGDQSGAEQARQRARVVL